MISRVFSSRDSLLAFGFTVLMILGGAMATSFVENGDFEDLEGYFPAGVLVRRAFLGRQFVPHWKAIEEAAPVEIVSSLVWQSSSSSDESSLYAVHLNSRAGPGGIETEFPSPWKKDNSRWPATGRARYALSVDVAGHPSGGLSVNRLEVVVSPSECRSQKLSISGARDASSKLLNWKTEHLVLDVQGSDPTVLLQFRSLTPGAYGPIIDNVRLIPLQVSGDADSSAGFCDHKNVDEMEETPIKSWVDDLVERVWMPAETWIRLRFFRRGDW